MQFPGWQGFFSFVSSFSLGAPFSSSSATKRIQRNFDLAGINTSPSKYAAGSFFLSFLLSAPLSAILAFALALDALGLLALFLLTFALILSSLILLPSACARAFTKEAEAELPFVLRELAIYLDIGLPFEKAIYKIACGSYLLSPTFMRAYKEIKAGATVQAALGSISLQSNSMQIKRSALLLASIYETGTGTESLKRMAEELSAQQISNMRAQGGRLSLLAILFVASSALLPSFFSVFAALSPMFLESSMTLLQVQLAFLLVFPALNALSLSAFFLFLPSFRRGTIGGTRILSEFLERKGFPYGANGLAALALFMSFLPAIFFLYLGSLPLFFLSICIGPAAYMSATYLAQREVDEAESRLPDALYSAAAVHRLLSAEKMLSFLAKGGYGRLSASFDIALRRQKAGETFARSMQAAAENCPSQLTKRAFDLLVVAYETGAAMHAALRETAQDVASFFGLVRERAAILSIQRYTILAASSILVPFIIGTVVSMVPLVSSAVSSPTSNGVFGTAQAQPDLAALCQIYLLVNAAISSLFLALSQSSPTRAAIYFSAIAPISQLIFQLASSSGISAIAH
ncbi:MAG: type II secretion system F family protein [Candidatus Micrarchaeota archaeon]|nr:type II secretion system F family protein [Candidatus Micrarchaeota archaeon]